MSWHYSRLHRFRFIKDFYRKYAPLSNYLLNRQHLSDMGKTRCSESHECSKEELNFHSIPAIQTVISSSYFEEHNPIASIDDDSAPITFEISGSSDDFTDLSSIYYEPTFKVVKGNGSDLTDEDVGPINNLLHSHIQQIDVYLNGVNICPPSGEYNYKA